MYDSWLLDDVGGYRGGRLVVAILCTTDGILLRRRKAVNIGLCRDRNLYRDDPVLLESGSVRTVKSLNVQITL